MDHSSSPAQFAIAPLGSATAEALEKVIQRHHQDLLQFLRKRALEQDAADLAQETYARLLRYRGREEEPLRLLLFRIARNLLKDHYRNQQGPALQNHLPIDEVELLDDAPSQEARMAQIQRLKTLEESILDLPPKCRAVFILSRLEGMSNLQIAQHCGISAKTVEKHLSIAITRCRQHVGDLDPSA